MKKYNHTISHIGPVRPLHLLLIIVCATIAQTALAQQAPVFSTYVFNKFLINPAFTGIDNEYRAFGFYRTQWTDIPGSPVTGGASIEGAFWKNRIGAGISVVNDKIGIFNRTSITGAYAQKIKFAKQHQIAIGVQGGAFINHTNFSEGNAVDAADPGLAIQKSTKTVFYLNLGISYKWKNLLLGFSVPNVIQSSAKFSNTTDYQYVRHYSAFAQYKISLLKGNFNITPTVVMRKGKASGFQADATLMFDYKNMVFIGAGYRNAFGVIGMAGVNIMDMFTVAYAYDYTTQRVLKGQAGSTHEIVAGFHIATDYKRKKKDEPNDILAEGQSIDDLMRKNDTLSAKVKATKQKLEEANGKVNTLKNDNQKLNEKVDSLSNVIGSSGNAATINTTNSKNTLPDNFTGKAEKNGTYTLDQIYFKANESTLLPESKKQLDLLVAFLKQSPETEISVKGYADNTGGDMLNSTLSLRRAQAVANYLTDAGIDARRISSKGYGSKNPVADNTTEAGRKLNRRVEFTIVK
jgi:type IX secretion system PorP/SprF family membrane protein